MRRLLFIAPIAMAVACGDDGSGPDRGTDAGAPIADATPGSPDAPLAQSCDDTVVWEGDLVIDGPDDIAAVAGCTTINGDVTIEGTDLTDLDGLEQIIAIYHELVIRDNPSLENVDGLVNLEALGRLVLVNNDALVSVAGMSSISRLRGLRIESHALLASLEGFHNMTSVGFPFGDPMYILGNEALTDLDGLRALERVGGDLVIGDPGLGNTSLTRIDGLGPIEAIAGDLRVGFNTQLDGLDGLDGVISVGGDLVIQVNDALASLDGLASLDVVGTDLSISANVALPTCEADALLDHLVAGGFSGNANIAGNDDNATCP